MRLRNLIEEIIEYRNHNGLCPRCGKEIYFHVLECIGSEIEELCCLFCDWIEGDDPRENFEVQPNE